MSDTFLEYFQEVRAKVAEAGAELTISLVIPEVDEKWLYSLRRLSESDNPTDWLAAIEAHLKTNQFRVEKDLAEERKLNIKLQRELRESLQKVNFEVNAYDMFWLSDTLAKIMGQIGGIVEERAGEETTDLMINTIESSNPGINTSNALIRLYESLLKEYREKNI